MNRISLVGLRVTFSTNFHSGRRPAGRLCFVALLVALPLLTAHAAELRGALAKVDITPTQPVRMAGYDSRKDLSKGVHDPLGARTLALENGGQHLVLISLDSLGFYNNTAE